MNLEVLDAGSWSKTMFGDCDLGDKRLTARLVQIGEQLSAHTGNSLSGSCEGEASLLEGSYRFIRNERVEAKQIAESGYETTADLAQEIGLLLAIEDTTSLSYTHQVKDELGDISSSEGSWKRGFIVHTTMLIDAEKEKTVGLIAQERWCRDSAEWGKKHQRAERAYEEKESYKWEKNTLALEKRLGNKLKDVISICDREADIYEYIQYKVERNQRFIVRASHNRKVKEDEVGVKKMLEHMELGKIFGKYEVKIAQKAGRKKRVVEVEVKMATVTLLPPERKKQGLRELKPIILNVVVAKEKNPMDDNETLEWILLTTEPVTTFDEARKITRYYELRWRIEDFHKAWKSGTGVEEQRMQSVENLEKMIVILSFVAIRLLQLKECFEHERILPNAEDICVSCDKLLSETEWKVLWATVEKKELPQKIPNAAWAYKAIAKLGGWYDSKRTGKVAWSTLWKGWFRLNERIEGFLAATRLSQMEKKNVNKQM